MHELALARSVVATVEAEAAAQSFARATRIRLDIGALSCVDPHALEFGFAAAAAGTAAEGAVLDIRVAEGRARCFACDSDVTVAAQGEACPRCGSHRLVIVGGEEMKIRELEVI